jgi:hypothetical protein
LLARKKFAEGKEDEIRKNDPGRNAHLREATVEATPVARGVLDCDEHGTAPFSADTESLNESQRYQ